MPNAMESIRTAVSAAETKYAHLDVCSNHMIGGGQLLRVRDNTPLEVHPGLLPQVWLRMPTDVHATNFMPLVEASVPTHPAARVMETSSGLLVLVNGMEVVRIQQQSHDQATIDLIDLRPVGFDVVGTKNELRIGKSTYRNNTFTNVSAMVSYDPSPKPDQTQSSTS